MSRLDDGSLFGSPPSLAEAPVVLPHPTVAPAPRDHRLGHRQRLRERFLKAGPEGIAPYELLELILFQAQPRSDKKALAKELIDRFGSFAEVLTAPADRLREVDGIGEAAIMAFRIVEAAAQQLVKGEVAARKKLMTASDVTKYLRARMAFGEVEEFRVLFLDKRGALIRDEVETTGTVDHVPVYPRNIIKRALALNATGLILVHNHPSGEPSPSQSDIAMTKHIVALARAMEIDVVDHVIIGRNGHKSLRKEGLM